MKLVKKLVVWTLALVMVISTSITTLASANVSMYEGDSFSVVDGVDYADYEVTGSASGHTETAHVLTFNPEDGYVSMAFAAHAGSCDTLASQYNTAVNKYGYEVAGVINGSYFDMETGTLTGMLISGGKVSCADIGYTIGNKTSVVAFGYDGSMNIVDTQLSYNVYINGTLVPNALRFMNKVQSSDGWRTDAIYYYDTSCGSIADTSTDGYEVICQKVNGTDLSVGKTLKAEVVEVKTNTSGTQFETNTGIVSDKFILSTGSDTTYAAYLSGLKAGDIVEIKVDETVAESKKIMENASSAITNVGVLVKDGVDMTDTYTVIGDHNVSTTYSQWTAFGQKADGTYVFFTSEGGSTGDSSRSLTLKDVAAAMIKLGCKNVIRLDGGGSSAMYLSNTGSGSDGYIHSSSRAVADCILIVKSSKSKADLNTAISEAEDVSFADYSEETLTKIRAAYENAKMVFASTLSTDADYKAAADELNALLATKDEESTLVKDGIFVTNFNSSIEAGDCTIFTSAFNKGKITADAANHCWTANVVLTWSEAENAYVVTSVSQGEGASTPTITLADSQILIAAHDGGDSASAANKALLAQAQVGQKLEVYGIDIASCEFGVAPYVSFDTNGLVELPEIPEVPEEPEVPIDPENPLVPGTKGVCSFANGYDWDTTINQIYIYASSDASASISTLAGQPANTFGWWHTIILEENEDGNYVVTSAEFGKDNNGDSETLGAGKVIIMAHDTTTEKAEDFAWFKALKAGDVVTMDASWLEVATAYGEVEIAFSLPAGETEEPDDPEHNLVHVEAVEAGCHYEGNIEHWYCLDCETVWQDEALTQVTNHKNVILPALGSENVVYFPAVAPGCHYDGCIEYWYCPDCEGVWQDEALTQITNIKNIVVPAVGGDVDYHEAVAPTCENEGNIAYWTCDECEQVWQDEALTQLTNIKNVVLPAIEHANLVHMEAVAPACHYEGNIEHWYCPDCETVWQDEALTQITNHKNVVLPELGGDVTYHEAVEPGCHYEGNIAYWTCAECEQVWQDEALTQLTNIKNVVLPGTGSENFYHVEAVAPT
ncbi:MAG: phosphodiester glycosidase family protein, partial [Agathobacter sp.]|nr:phosphodiester glycosidase family protein [Agathobacter sp.]